MSAVPPAAVSPAPDKRSAAAPGGRSARRLTRRDLLMGAVALGGAAGAARLAWDDLEHMHRAAVVVARADRYDASLVEIIERGLAELNLDRSLFQDKSILLKPNLVEPSASAPHVNTHPEFVRAVAEVFRRRDAREVFIAEGQGHCRDTYFVLEQSGLEPVLDDDRLEFVDLNHDDVFTAHNRSGCTRLAKLYLPQTLRRADFIVSLPKLKTHHWTGVSLSMKNLFGVMPGICYGWPKNVLHYAGIDQSIVDINATVGPHLAIVDGIVGMEGDGPIMGTPRHAGLVVMGTNLPAVDATCARLMGFDPFRIAYLRLASGRLGPIQDRHIQQRGEPIAELAQRFELLDLPHFRQFRE